MNEKPRAAGRALRFPPDALRLTPAYVLLARPYRALRARADRWLFQLDGAQTTSVVLVQRRIFILPSRHGLLFVAALGLMLSGSINYNLSLGFILTFLLAALGVNGILHTFRNLARLRIATGRVQPVFAAIPRASRWSSTTRARSTAMRSALPATSANCCFTDAPALQSTAVGVPVPAPARGMLRPGRLTIFTNFPLGLCYAWAYAELDMHCIVYPRPEAGRVPLPPFAADDATGITHGAGQEDFAGLRRYHPGDSPRHIAWKAAARGEALLTKQFSGRAASELWLDWRATPDTLTLEGRLSRLARWVIDAHAAGLSFGLRLPDVTIPAAPGDAQRDRCLEALALYKAAPA